MTPLFLQIEYNAPGFPDDPYGFTRQDRLKWANIALDYLRNPEGISFLGDLRFDDGTVVYNERELQHMVDVKQAIRGTMLAWYSSLGLLAITGLWAWRAGWGHDYFRAISRGGWLTVFVLISILILVLFAFGYFFVAFHNVFFQTGTWTFEYSDTLIRLFPERFWRDGFLFIGALSIAGALALAYGARSKK
jgi:integral membrane protein (TIGR01906 family)